MQCYRKMKIVRHPTLAQVSTVYATEGRVHTIPLWLPLENAMPEPGTLHQVVFTVGNVLFY